MRLLGTQLQDHKKGKFPTQGISFSVKELMIFFVSLLRCFRIFVLCFKFFQDFFFIFGILCYCSVYRVYKIFFVLSWKKVVEIRFIYGL